MFKVGDLVNTKYGVIDSILKVLETYFFVSNKGIGFEAQVYLKDLAPIIGEIPSWLKD